jgi:hypothetical protein
LWQYLIVTFSIDEYIHFQLTYIIDSTDSDGNIVEWHDLLVLPQVASTDDPRGISATVGIYISSVNQIEDGGISLLEDVSHARIITKFSSTGADKFTYLLLALLLCSISNCSTDTPEPTHEVLKHSLYLKTLKNNYSNFMS